MKKEFEKRILSSLIIIPTAFFFIIKGSVFFGFFLGVFFLTTSYEWLKMNKKNSLKLLGIIYLLATTYFAYLLRDSFGVKIFIFVIIICIFTDIGGYIFGKIFKGPKLIKISPNKTVSGSIGSFFSSLALAPIYFLFFSNVSLINLFFIALLVSLFCQIGDLLISFLKRKAKVEDTGSILPGHGGLLDRIDGMLFAIPLGIILSMLLTKGL